MGWLFAGKVKNNQFTMEDVRQIINESSFKDLTETSIIALGGCSEVADMSESAVINYLKWKNQN